MRSSQATESIAPSLRDGKYSSWKEASLVALRAGWDIPTLSRVQRLKRAPFRLLLSKILELGSRLLPHGLPIEIPLVWNDRMTVVFPEQVSTHLFRYGVFEPKLTRIFFQILRPGQVFLDVGAHFGYHSILGSRLVGPGGAVHSFEPIPSTFAVLSRNVRARQNVSIHNLAVFSRPQEIRIFDYGLRNSAFDSIREPRLSPQQKNRLHVKPILARATSLDEFCRSFKLAPNVIKIDVESAEWEIVSGMKETLRLNQPIVIVEVGDLGVEGAPPSRFVIKALEELGYAAQEFGSFDQPLVPHRIRESYTYDNLVFVPREVS